MTKTNTFFLILLTIAVMSIIGCAAIIHGSKQDISFQSTPSGATIEVFDGTNFSYGVCETPCTMQLKRKKSYKAVFSKPGYEKAEMIIENGTSGWIWGNLFLDRKSVV